MERYYTFSEYCQKTFGRKLYRAALDAGMYWNCLATALLHPLSFVLPNGLRAAGDAKYTMIVGVVSMFVVRISMAYLLGSVLHLFVLGTYFAMFLDWCARIVCFTLRYHSGKWMNYRAI